MTGSLKAICIHRLVVVLTNFGIDKQPRVYFINTGVPSFTFSYRHDSHRDQSYFRSLETILQTRFGIWVKWNMALN